MATFRYLLKWVYVVIFAGFHTLLISPDDVASDAILWP